jgi:hypothetical protein
MRCSRLELIRSSASPVLSRALREIGRFVFSSKKIMFSEFLVTLKELEKQREQAGPPEIMDDEVKELQEEKRKLEARIHEKNEVLRKMIDDVRTLLLVIKSTG